VEMMIGGIAIGFALAYAVAVFWLNRPRKW
jgi:hypothetical protein